MTSSTFYLCYTWLVVMPGIQVVLFWYKKVHLLLNLSDYIPDFTINFTPFREFMISPIRYIYMYIIYYRNLSV